MKIAALSRFESRSYFSKKDSTIKIKEIVDENFQDYRKASMFIATEKCDFKCMTELGLDTSICQNEGSLKKPSLVYSFESIFDRYTKNLITKAIVIGGLEPMLQFPEVFGLVEYFRSKGINDDVVIYTGYYKHEIMDKVEKLKQFKNIIVKFGRFIPNSERKFDKELGIFLSSSNQYSEKIG